MHPRTDIQALTCATAEEWETWLAEHQSTSAEVWLRIAKKNAPTSTVTITEALDTALCYGWIDSHRRALDADHYLQRYSPRRPKSPWSRINRKKAEALIAAGRMRAAGHAAIAAAVADGRWPDTGHEAPPDHRAPLPADDAGVRRVRRFAE